MKYLIEICLEPNNKDDLFGPPLPPGLSEDEIKGILVQRMGTSPLEQAIYKTFLELMAAGGSIDFLRVRLYTD